MNTETKFIAASRHPAKKIRIVAEIMLLSPLHVTAIESGAARAKLDQLAALSQQLKA